MIEWTLAFPTGCKLLDFSRGVSFIPGLTSRNRVRGSIHIYGLSEWTQSAYPVTCTFIFLDPVTTPVLNIFIQKQTNLYITLRCISFNGSLPINYTFFEKGIALSPVISKHVREHAEFNLTKSNTGEGEEYSCEAKNSLPDYSRHSHPVTMPSTSKDYLSSFNRSGFASRNFFCLSTSHFGHLLPSAFPLVGSIQAEMRLLSATETNKKRSHRKA